MDTLVSNATTSFETTTGFGIGDAVTWMADNLLKPFMGAGLALLYELRYWIVALVIIAAVIYFAYRAFRFFRH